MASAQQKPKPATSKGRNDSRPNGKAPKKNPKIPPRLTPEQKAAAIQRDADRKQRNDAKNAVKKQADLIQAQEMQEKLAKAESDASARRARQANAKGKIAKNKAIITKVQSAKKS